MVVMGCYFPWRFSFLDCIALVSLVYSLGRQTGPALIFLSMNVMKDKIEYSI